MRIACLSYAPYYRPGTSPLKRHTFMTRAQIDNDLRRLSHVSGCVRTYSQSQGLSAVPAIAKRYGMQVLMGIWLGRDRKANSRELAQGIANARKYAAVLRGVMVGNEVLLRGEMSPQALARQIRRVRAAIPANVPVSYADVWENWLRYRQLATVVDEITIHILPYWENEPVAVARAVRHLARVYARVQRAFPGKRVRIGETGWPSAGRPRRAAIPSLVNEARYLRQFLAYAAHAHIPYNLVEAFDQPWKRVQEGTVGGYWGMLDRHAQSKFPMRGPVVEVPRWWLGCLAAVLGMLCFGLSAIWSDYRHDWRVWLALSLSGLSAGSAFAWQWRQMDAACTNTGEWVISGLSCILACYTALSLARQVAAHLIGAHDGVRKTSACWHFAWLFVMTFYSLLEVFDGRYRDFPIGLFALPCLGYAALAWVQPDATIWSLLEQRFLAVMLMLLSSVIVIEEHGQNLVVWFWLGLSLALTMPLWISTTRVSSQPSGP